jgi:hypothetical protein
MMDVGFIVLFIDWAEGILETPYFYVAVGVFFTGILFFTLWHLLGKPHQASDSHSGKAHQTATEQHYSQCAAEITRKIRSMNGNNKVILFAGASLETLPVTIPIKIAIALAQSDYKCLFIDLDTRRNAAAKAFELNSNTTAGIITPYPLQTVIRNLLLWPAEFFVRFSQINIRIVTQAAKKHYHIVLINAPYLDGHPDRKLIASSADYGLIFYNKQAQLGRLKAIFSENDCRLIQSQSINELNR